MDECQQYYQDCINKVVQLQAAPDEFRALKICAREKGRKKS